MKNNAFFNLVSRIIPEQFKYKITDLFTFFDQEEIINANIMQMEWTWVMDFGVLNHIL